MKTRTKILIALGVVVLVGAIAYFIYKKQKIDIERLLKRGDVGKEVVQLQLYLNAKQPDRPQVAVTGYFDAKTEASLIAFMKKKETTLHNLYLYAITVQTKQPTAMLPKGVDMSLGVV